MGFTTRKEGAVEAGINYEYYCKRLNRKMAKIRRYLKQEGYEKEDFINIGIKGFCKKVPMIVLGGHDMVF